jgi:chemotaxis protein histidine kinase CheA
MHSPTATGSSTDEGLDSTSAALKTAGREPLSSPATGVTPTTPPTTAATTPGAPLESSVKLPTLTRYSTIAGTTATTEIAVPADDVLSSVSSGTFISSISGDADAVLSAAVDVPVVAEKLASSIDTELEGGAVPQESALSTAAIATATTLKQSAAVNSTPQQPSTQQAEHDRLAASERERAVQAAAAEQVERVRLAAEAEQAQRQRAATTAAAAKAERQRLAAAAAAAAATAELEREQRATAAQQQAERERAVAEAAAAAELAERQRLAAAKAQAEAEREQAAAAERTRVAAAAAKAKLAAEQAERKLATAAKQQAETERRAAAAAAEQDSRAQPVPSVVARFFMPDYLPPGHYLDWTVQAATPWTDSISGLKSALMNECKVPDNFELRVFSVSDEVHEYSGVQKLLHERKEVCAYYAQLLLAVHACSLLLSRHLIAFVVVASVTTLAALDCSIITVVVCICCCMQRWC